MNKKIPFFIVIALFLTAFNALSKDNGIKILSDQLNINMNERKSTFTGNVYAYNKSLRIWSDKIIIKLRINKDEIKEILASGNVKIIRLIEGSKIYGDIADYSLEEDVIIIRGNVIVQENGNQISGSELIVDLKSSSSIMTGSDSNRVEALITSN